MSKRVSRVPSAKKAATLKDDGSSSDSGPEDRGPAKKMTPAKPSSENNQSVSDDPTWELGKLKKVKVRQFKGKTYIDIREYYINNSTMDTLPGKKGISLTPEQYQKLKSLMPEIDHALL